MSPRSWGLLVTISFAFGLGIFGCDQTKPKEAAAPKKTDADAGKPADKTAAASPATKTASGKTLLGAPELTAGIPGDGPLKKEEAEVWFADPKNHEVLDVELPMGLAAGASAITGLDKNPLTRAKIELGRQLYFDPRLSDDKTVSCASCHDPAEGFARHTQFGVGIRSQTGGRNSPVSYNRILSGKQFWDGRAESLEDQAKGPIANPIEMGNKHELCEVCLKGNPVYAMEFEKVFPGEGVTIDNVAKAIASFERAIVTGPSPYDYFNAVEPYTKQDEDDLKEDKATWEAYQQAKSDLEKHPFSDAAKHGRDLFFSQEVNCTACHVGANFTDEKYHNLGIGVDVPHDKADPGRSAISQDENEWGAFKTPTIRNVALSAPYMHDGSAATLEDVVEWYNQGGRPNPHLDPKIKKLNLSGKDKADLVEFLRACTGDFPLVQRERLPE